ncbi:MAG: hypothetical protein AAGM38_09645 [Pseudomonadota bacterium]
MSERGDGWSARAQNYIFGRNALIGAAAMMLLVISGVATYVGMSDFIIGVQGGSAQAADRTVGGLSLPTEVFIILVVAALTFLMWLALRETFRPGASIGARLLTLPLYIFLALWSIGFGYGFWWSLIAGPEATKAGLAGQAEDVRDAAVRVKARLEAVRARLDSVGAYSERQMARESAAGGTCGVRSGAGRGPLFRAREGVRDSVASLQTAIGANWLAAVDRDLNALNSRLGEASAAVTGDTLAERRIAFDTQAAAIRGAAQEIAARSDALGASYAAEMRQLAAEVSVEPGQSGFSCFDPSLAALLTEAADEAGAPANVTLRDAAFSEGAAGVARAVLGLWTNLGVYLSALPAVFAGEVSDARVAVESDGQPITGRDLIALLAVIGVDLGLFALTALNPPSAAAGRRDSLDDTLRRLNEPSSTLVAELSKVMKTGLQIAPGANLDWVRRHFFSHRGLPYFVIPDLSAWDPQGDDGRKALALNQLAGVMSELSLIQPLDRSRISLWRGYKRDLSRYESEARLAEAIDAASRVVGRRSYAELVKIREAEAAAGDDAAKARVDALPEHDFQNTLRRFGVRSTVEFRKYRPEFVARAVAALKISEWEGVASRAPEVYFVYHPEGIEPLLTVLEKGEFTETGAKPASAPRAALEDPRSAPAIEDKRSEI